VLVTDDNGVIDPAFVNPIATMAPGDIVTVEVEHVITQADIDLGYVENTAVATGETPDGTPVTDDSDTDTDTDGSPIVDNEETETPNGDDSTNMDPTDDPTVTDIEQLGELTVTKSQVSVSGTGMLGDVITYLVTVENTGNTTLSDVLVTDDNGVIDPAFVNPIATMAPGDVVTVEVTHIITQEDIDAGYVENSAVATGETPDGTPVTDDSDTDTDQAGDVIVDNEDTETPDGDGSTNTDPTDDPTVTPIAQNPSIALIKTGVFNDLDGDGCADLGETITYTFTVVNNGNQAITSSKVPVPDTLT
jgi:TusA-related sulfurtransferase